MSDAQASEAEKNVRQAPVLVKDVELVLTQALDRDMEGQEAHQAPRGSSWQWHEHDLAHHP